MAFVKLTKETPSEIGKRVLISGPPNSRKTTSLMTWPRPIHIVSFPGEKGYDSIDTTQEGVNAYVWRIDDVTKASPHAIVKEVEDITIEIIAGKHGQCECFAGDGLHKLYGWYYQRAKIDLAQGNPNLGDDVIDARAYGIAHDEFTLYLTKVSHSKVPYVVFTVWDGKELDDADAKKGPSHVFPDLPGKMAKRIMGEFSVVLYASVGLPPGPGKPAPATWQLQPAGKIWGAGVKVPPRIAALLPEKVEQDWAKLEPKLKG